MAITRSVRTPSVSKAVPLMTRRATRRRAAQRGATGASDHSCGSPATRRRGYACNCHGTDNPRPDSHIRNYLSPPVPSERICPHLTILACEVSWSHWTGGQSSGITRNLHSIDRQANVELHQQAAAEIRRAIADGEARPGDRPPPRPGPRHSHRRRRQHSAARPANSARRGAAGIPRARGITVAGTPDHSAVLQRAQELVFDAREHRDAPHELAQMIETLG
jgi:GntR family transcriptional regulator